MPDNLHGDVDEEIKTAIFAGQKIRAIKLYRELTGQGLKESKDFIEALTDELRARSPEQFKPAPAGGCGATMLALAAGLAMILLVLLIR